MKAKGTRAGRAPWRRPLVMLAGLLLLLLSAPAAAAGRTGPVSGLSAPAAGLDRPDLEALARASRNNRFRVNLLIATVPGRTGVVSAGIRRLGGTVAFRRDGIGYLRARVPLDRATEVPDLAAVEAVDVERLIPLEDPAPISGEPALPQDPPTVLTPRTNPYLPLHDTGADRFGELPARDGRGVRVAILDSGIDLAHEALQTTTTGAPKVIDWVNELPDWLDATWVETAGSHAGQFSAAGVRWTAPDDGARYAFGTLGEDDGDLAISPFEGDLNRNGIRGETIGVLQDRASLEVIVDANMNRDFTDDQVLIDYSADHQNGFLGDDDPGTGVEERVAFTVDTRKSAYPDAAADSRVNIGIAGSAHGTHVAGIAAANGLFGGAMSGAAPGAQLISVKVCPDFGGCSTSAMTEGMLYAARHGADIANLSVGMSIPVNAGRDAEAEIYRRIVDEYGMAIFMSAGNEGPGVKTVAHPSVARKVISVAAGISPDTWLANYGQVVDGGFSLATFSSRGPALDGSLKPEITAPGAAVSSIPPWQPGEAADGIYTLPAGYAMKNGTSMAAPQAAGAAALLIGAYRDAFGESPGPARLRRALLTSARPIPGSPVNGQGAGLIDTPEAWRLLQQMRSGRPPSSIKVEARVNSLLADRLAVPGRGAGIVEREAVSPGRRLTRTIGLTRTTGPVGNERFEVSFFGDVALSLPASISLPLGAPVSLIATITTGKPGLRSGLIRLDDPDTAGVDRLIPVTVMVSKPAAARIAFSGAVRKGGERGHTFRVPPGTARFRVELAGGGQTPGDGQLRFRMFNPLGMPHHELGTEECFIPDTGAGCRVGSAVTRTVFNPTPGVWEVDVEAFRRSARSPTPYTVTGSLVRASISPDPDRIAYRGAGRISRIYRASNPGVPFDGRLAGGPLAIFHREQIVIKPDEQILRPITVPAKTGRLAATFAALADRASTVNLNLFDCRQIPCRPVAGSEAFDGRASVAVADPPKGAYMVQAEVDGAAGSGAKFRLGMAIHHPRYGHITTDDSVRRRKSGSSWTARALISVGDRPPPGWTLGGRLRVTDGGRSTIARSRIDLIRRICPATPPGIALARIRPGPHPRPGRGRAGIVVGMRAGGRVIARISPRIRYRIHGRVRTVKLPRRSVQINGWRKLRFPVPRRMKRAYRRTRLRLKGSRVTFLLAATTRRPGTAPRCSRRVSRRKLRVRVETIRQRNAPERRGHRTGE